MGKKKDPTKEANVLIGGGVRYDVRMGKYSGLVVIAALLLTGCATPPAEAQPVDKDSQFIAAVRPVLDEYAFASDNALIDFAPEFCEQAADGITLDEMREGAKGFNSPAMADELVEMGKVALEVYCPDL